MKKHFNKNLIISEKEEEQFQSSNICWIYERLVDDNDEKVKDYCHITGKCRGAAHWRLDGHINNEDYLTCKKIGMNFTWKIWVIITTIIWKKMFCY